MPAQLVGGACPGPPMSRTMPKGLGLEVTVGLGSLHKSCLLMDGAVFPTQLDVCPEASGLEAYRLLSEGAVRSWC